MYRHTHAWRVTLYLLLALPSPDGFADRVTRWDCPCGAYAVIAGNVRMGTPLETPAYWEALSAAEQRQGTPEAQEAARQMRGGR